LSADAELALARIDEGAKASNSDSLLVLVDGKPVLERHAATPAPVLETMSATKSVVSLAIGALIGEGRIESLDVPVHSWFPEWKQGRKQQITLRMLLDHSSGLQNELRPAIEIYPAPDVIKLALAAELTHAPGTRMAYNNKAVNLLAGVIEKASGEPMDRYVQRTLLDPLGVKAGEWYRDTSGNPHAMAGLAMDARGLAAIGQLVLDKGRRDGRQIVPESYIDEMLRASRLSPDVGLLWMRRVAWVRFRADAESLAMIENAGVSPEFLAKLRPIEGRRFGSPDDLFEALHAHLGDSWFEDWHRELIEPHGIGPWRPFHSEKGPVEAFEANGSLGQYIVVIPKARLVAVRQIRARDEHSEADSYPDFTDRVQALADVLAPTAAD
jgi:CubicO group peptidase (beta-lactamase class C family)